MDKRRLYVWYEFLRDYSSGIAFAVARNADKARQAIIDDMELGPLPSPPDYEWTSSFDLLEEPKVYELDKTFGTGIWGGS